MYQLNLTLMRRLVLLRKQTVLRMLKKLFHGENMALNSNRILKHA
jgi:hypothetical protein